MSVWWWKYATGGNETLQMYGELCDMYREVLALRAQRDGALHDLKQTGEALAMLTERALEAEDEAQRLRGEVAYLNGIVEHLNSILEER